MREHIAISLAGIGLGALLLTGCSVTDDGSSSGALVTDQVTTDDGTDATGSAGATDAADDESSIELGALSEATSVSDLDLKEVDLDADLEGATTVTLADGASRVDGAGASVDGDTVTITASGTYVLSGSLSAGKVAVDADKAEVVLVLDGVDITAAEVAGIEVLDADWVVLDLAEGSSNAVSDAAGATESDEEDAANAAIYATSDLWITGSGSLRVNGVAADGITSKDSLVIDAGTVEVAATDDGLRGKDHLVIRGGAVTVESGGDALKSDNEADADDASALVGRIWIADGTLDLTSGSDAVDAYNQVTIEGGELTIAAEDDAVHADGILRITSGTIDVTASYEGLEGALIYLDGGTATVVSSDDGLNASDGSGSSEPGLGGGRGAGMPPGGGDAEMAPGGGGAGEQVSDAAIEISGGDWFFDSEGDGVDSNGNVSMSGGTVVVAGPTGNGNGALDYNGTFEIDGGTVVATGSAGMAQAPDGGSQAVIGISFGQTVTAGTAITVTDSDGVVVASVAPAKDTQTLVVSSPALDAGETYSITIGGDVSGTATFGLITDGTLSGGESAGTIEAS